MTEQLSDIQKARALSAFSSGEEGHEINVSGRNFLIKKADEESFVAFELRPTGSLTKDGIDFDWSLRDEIKDAYLDPNNFLGFLESKSIEPSWVVKSGGGFGVGTIYYNSVAEALGVIQKALDENEVVRCFYSPKEMFEKTPIEEHVAKRVAELRGSIAFWENAKLPVSDKKTLFSNKASMLGEALKPEHVKEILSYMNRPTLKKWHKISGLSITPLSTVWQMMCRIKLDFPLSGDEFNESNIPSKADMEEMLLDAVELHNNRCNSRLKKAKKELDAFDADAYVDQLKKEFAA